MTKCLSIIILSLALSLPAGVIPAGAAMYWQTVSYRQDGEKLKGYLAYDPAIREPRPAVLVVHEWWGLNDYLRLWNPPGRYGLPIS